MAFFKKVYPVLYIFLNYSFLNCDRLYALDKVWGSVAGLTSDKYENAYFLWSFIKSPYYEFGTFIRRASSFIYGGMGLTGNNFEAYIGYLGSPIFNSFLLSYGEEYPDSDSLPFNRPLGYSFRIKYKWLSLGFADYRKPASENSVLDFSGNRHEIQLLDAGVIFSNAYWSIKFTSGIYTFSPITILNQYWVNNPADLFNAFVNFKINVWNIVDIDFIYTGNLEWNLSLILNFNMIHFRLDYNFYDEINEKNKFRSGFFNPHRPFYLNITSRYMIVRIFEKDKSMNFRWKMNVNGFGSYYYKSAERSLLGLYYKSDVADLKPYIALYFSPDIKTNMQSLGITFGESWMLAVLHSNNQTGEYFPFDPIAVPVRFYQESLSFDNQNVYNHSYLGLQFLWGNENLFFYSALLQNFQETKSDSLIAIVRFQYRHRF